ncbi:B12-binding domain-containing protein [Syntrophomonas palmitatica]|uniref:B12-binding domain-containing protein n=1 Tax=Syntrophomonas palmitatica TaxID=402877 RepID=UPI000B0F0B7C|nr:B12-binding domain-containing protein [Syntrophomonas palmitatica]
MKKHEILDGLARAVVNMDTDSVINLAQKSLEMMIPAEEAIENGLSRGMEIVGDLFAAAEYFVPEVVVCADTMYAGLNILKPAVIRQIKPKGKIVIGVVEGDTHDIARILLP